MPRQQAFPWDHPHTVERFFKRLQLDVGEFWRAIFEDECVLFPGQPSNDWPCFRARGFPGLAHDGVPVRAHRYSFTLFRGEIPEGHDVDHMCRHRNCVQPFHLQTLGHSEHATVTNHDRWWDVRSEDTNEWF